MDVTGIVSDFLDGIISEINSTIASIQNVVGANVYGGYIDGRENPFSNLVRYGHQCCMDVATALCAVLFFIEFLKITVKMDILKIEYLFTVVLKLTMARLCIDIGGNLLGSFNAICMAVIREVDVSEISSGTINLMKLKISEACNDLELLEAIGLLATMLIPAIAIKVIGLMGIVLAWGRFVELTIYHVVYPLPFAALMLDHADITKKFMLSFLSVGLQGAIMMIGVKLFKIWVIKDLGAIIAAIGAADVPYSEVSKMSFSLLLACLLMIVTMMKSGQWAQKVCGV